MTPMLAPPWLAYCNLTQINLARAGDVYAWIHRKHARCKGLILFKRWVMTTSRITIISKVIGTQAEWRVQVTNLQAESRAANGQSPAITIIDSLWIAAGLAMVPAVAWGLARFAYALLVPGMQADLSWSYTDAGSMNTANALGYLVGALVAAKTAALAGAKRAFLISMLFTAAALLASGLTSVFLWLLALRMISGVGGAIAFVIGAAMVVSAVPKDKPKWMPLAMGVYVGGGGLGILISAAVVPPLLAFAGWRGGWIILGLASFISIAIAIPALRRVHLPPPHPHGADHKGWSLAFLLPALVSYGLFGAGYIAYMTFIVAYLRGLGFTGFDVSLFWACLGTATLFAAVIWSPVVARFKGGWSMVAPFVVVTVGALLPVISGGYTAVFLSAILFGGSFLAVVSAVTSFAGRTVQPHALTSVMAVLTVAFGLGQCIGPVLSGAISDGPRGVQTGLLLSAGILFAGAIVAMFQREPVVQYDAAREPRKTVHPSTP